MIIKTEENIQLVSGNQIYLADFSKFYSWTKPPSPWPTPLPRRRRRKTGPTGSNTIHPSSHSGYDCHFLGSFNFRTILGFDIFFKVVYFHELMWTSVHPAQESALLQKLDQGGKYSSGEEIFRSTSRLGPRGRNLRKQISCVHPVPSARRPFCPAALPLRSDSHQPRAQA